MIRAGVVIGSQHRGGAEHYLLRLYGGLAEYGVDAMLLGRLPSWEHTGLASKRVGLGPKWSSATILPSLLRLPAERYITPNRIARAVRAAPVGYFHCQFKREQILLTGPLAEFAPVVWTEHGRLPSGTAWSALAPAYARAAAKTSCIICVSDQIADDVDRLCRGRARIEVIPNAVDTARFRPPTAEERSEARRQLGIDTARPVLCAVSRLHPDKRLDRALRLASHHDALLVVAGEGTDRNRLESTARELGASVRFVGHLEDPTPVYRAADGFVSACSPTEGHNLAVLEAAASGLPLLGFEGDPGVEFITACRGVVLAEGRVAEIDHLDEALRVDAGRAAHAQAQLYGVEQWLARHAAILAGTLS